jgi:hypothetical protein
MDRAPTTRYVLHQEDGTMMTTGMSWFLLEQLAVVRHEERLRERGASRRGRGNASPTLSGPPAPHRRKGLRRDSDQSTGNP